MKDIKLLKKESGFADLESLKSAGSGKDDKKSEEVT